MSKIYEEKKELKWTFAANPNLIEDLEEVFGTEESIGSGSASKVKDVSIEVQSEKESKVWKLDLIELKF